MFEIGDYIVHGGRGVCLVEDICTPDFEDDRSRRYYVLHPIGAADNSRMFCPVDNRNVFMRRVMSACEVSDLILRMPKISPLCFENDKRRKDAYKKLLAEPYPVNLVSLIKTIYKRKERLLLEKKKLPFFEFSLDSEAKKVLHEEMSLSLGVPADEIEAYIVRTIEGAK